jgi:hypothetical protein
MALFDPKKARDENKNQGIPPNDYLIAIKSFVRKTSKKGKQYLHCRFVVVAGPAKKRSFFDNISLDLENSGAMFRLGILSEQCGVEGPFDLDDDAAIEAALVGRPFKAKVNRTTENGYVNNGIERYLTGNAVTDRDRAAMDEWVTAEAEKEEWSGSGSSEPDPDYDPTAPPPGDDDIPF